LVRSRLRVAGAGRGAQPASAFSTEASSCFGANGLASTSTAPNFLATSRNIRLLVRPPPEIAMILTLGSCCARAQAQRAAARRA